MLIGLISDTHGLLRPEVFTAFEGVDHILHAGDIGDSGLLLELEAIAPVTAVWGNTDDAGLRGALPEVAEIELGGVRIRIVHGQQYGSPTAPLVGARNGDVDMVVFGHSHRPETQRVGSVLAVNPGSAGPSRLRLPVTVALAEVEDGRVSARHVTLVGR